MPLLIRIRFKVPLLLYRSKGLLVVIVMLAREEIGGLLAPLVVLAFLGFP